MQKRLRVIAAAMTLMMILALLSGCSAVNTNPIVGKVGDVDITYTQFANTFSQMSQYADYGAYEFEDPDHPLPELREMVFETLIDAAVPVAIAHQRGVTLDASEEETLKKTVEETMKSDVASVANELGEGLPYEQQLSYFKKQIKQNGYTYDAYMAAVEQGTREQMLSDKMRAEVEANITADEDIMHDWYDKELELEKESYDKSLQSYYEMSQYYSYLTGVPPLYRPEGFTFMKQIYIANPAEGETKDVDAMVADIQTRFAAGEDFDTLVAEYNEDTGTMSTSDGYLYNTDISGNYPEEFGKAAEGLKEGAISDPVAGESGVRILYNAGAAPSAVTPYEDIEEELYAYTLKTAKEDAFTEAIAEWREGLEIVTYPKRVETVGTNS